MNRVRENCATNEPASRRALRFYWTWLVIATTVSILGNITHAILVAPDDLRLLAALASVVPPTFVLGSTHSVALGLTMRRLALVHTLGLIMTIGVAACAFLLSFDALRSLAVMLGWPSGIAWLFPIAIDVSIAQATFGLLSMSAGPTRARPVESKTTEGQSVSDLSPVLGDGDTRGWGTGASPSRDLTVVDSGQSSPCIGNLEQVPATRQAPPTEGRPGSKQADTAVVDTSPTCVDIGDLMRWQRTANELVRNGTTSKDPDTVAAILAEYALGTPPSTIGRRRGVHHSTVGRILAGAEALTS